jgi:alpha-L-fucosidase
MTGYGKVDILWLDGGWVRPKNTIDASVDWQRTIPYDQDIDMAKIAAAARIKQPGLIVVDRTVAGQYENYTTPEQQVPDAPLDHPWESCITMGNSWSYVPGDHYKSANEIVTLLVKIVSRGGNLLMNIGPGPDGDWDPVAYSHLKQIGDWIKINGEGIYSSNAIAPYSEGNIYYTKVGKSIYAFVLAEKGQDNVVLPAKISLHLKDVGTVQKISLLGISQKLKYTVSEGVININIPASLQTKNGLQQAAVFKIQ